MMKSMMGAMVSVLLVSACATNGDLYTGVDADADGLVDRDEFYMGADEFGVFDDWDTDYDGYLDADEFGFGMGEIGLDANADFESWDVDRNGLLTDRELYEGTFRDLDTDDDGFLDRNEFEYGIRAPIVP